MLISLLVVLVMFMEGAASGPSRPMNNAGVAEKFSSTTYNVSVGYNVSSVTLNVSWHLNPGYAGYGNETVGYQSSAQTVLVNPSGNSVALTGAIVQPNVTQTIYFSGTEGNFRVKFIWPGGGTSCTVTCQPLVGSDPSSSCQ